MPSKNRDGSDILCTRINSSGCFSPRTSSTRLSGCHEYPGKRIILSDGATHYGWAGPDNGEVVVLIHGFATPSFIWDKTVPALSNAGFRVLWYDLFGRGYSDRPETEYNATLFDRQLLELLDKLEANHPVHLVGLSMGGAIATRFAANHPDRADRLILIGPAGCNVRMPPVARLARIPLIGGLLMQILGGPLLIRGLKDNLATADLLPELEEGFRRQLAFRGFKRAVLSTLRHFNLAGQHALFEAVGRQNRPVLLIWGRQDRVVPTGVSAAVRKAMPGSELKIIDQAGHIAQYERAEAVNPLMVKFLPRPAGPNGPLSEALQRV